MSSATFKGLSGLALSASFLALNAPAMAQLSDIVVTAQKRGQNLQDVPISITAFDVEALEINRITGLQDIGRVTPGVYVTPNSADQNGVQINIRGIGILDPQIGQDGRVAIYQDGVYIGKTQGLAFDLPDLARVEILKGPQGTLYGRNTVAGAVNLISARPDPDAGLSGKISAEYGNYNHRKINGAINIPLAEKAAARISGYLLDRDGWVENNGPGTDFGGERKYGFRGAVGMEIGSEFRLDLSADYSKIENESLFYQAFGPGAPPFAAPITPFDAGRQESVTTSFAPEDGNTEIKGASIIGTWTPSEGHEVKTTIAYREADSSRFVALAPTANPAIVNAITNGFNQALAPLPFAFGATGATLRPDFSSAFSGMPPHGPEAGLFLSPPGGSANLVGHSQFSAELTYNGSFADGKLDYTGGLFYYNEETGTGPVISNLTNANDYLFVLGAFNPLVTPQATRDFLTGFGVPASATGPIPGSLALLSFLQTPLAPLAFPHLQGLNAINSAFLSAARQSASNTLFIDSKAFAIYGQATWHATDDLRITGGLRYSDESRDGRGQSFSPFFIDTTDLTGNPILPNISTYEDDKLDPTIILEYDASEDVLLYASYKQSYRAGGFNAAAVGNRLPGETFGPDFNFGREDITAYEVGFKGTFGGKVRLNAAGFYSDFKNKQSTISLNPLIATSRAIVNTDDEIYGFEFDGQFAITDDLTFRGSYTYIDGNAGDLVNPLSGVVTMQDEIQGTPKNSYLVALDYNGDFDGRSVFGNVTYSHKDDILRVPNVGTRLGASDLVNAQVGFGFEFGGNEGTLAIWAENLLDEEYEIDKIGFNTFSHEVKVYGQPRSYGVTAGVKF